MPRFDEIELHGREGSKPADRLEGPRLEPAGILSRAVAFIIDLSLFVAAAIAMSPIIPPGHGSLPARLAIVGFLILVSLYYLGLGWMVWGKTIGAAIADVRVVSDDLGDVNVSQATRRWAGTILSLLTLGVGFLPGISGQRRTMADRMSGTRVVRRP